MGTFGFNHRKTALEVDALMAAASIGSTFDLFDEDGLEIQDDLHPQTTTARSPSPFKRERTLRLLRHHEVSVIGPASVTVVTYGVQDQFAPESTPKIQRSHPAVAQVLVRELARLTVGWAGPGTVPPSDRVIHDILHVASCLPSGISLPEAEVDPDDGSVVLRWFSSDMSQSFSLTFLGRGEVTGFLSSPPATPAWKNKVLDAVNLTSKFNDEGVLALLLK